NIAAPARTVNTVVSGPSDDTPSVAPPAMSAVKPVVAQRSVTPPPNPESTVKIYFVDKGPPVRASGTQHAAAKLGREELPLDPSASKGVPAMKDSAASAILAARAGGPT